MNTKERLKLTDDELQRGLNFAINRVVYYPDNEFWASATIKAFLDKTKEESLTPEAYLQAGLIFGYMIRYLEIKKGIRQ